MKLIQAFVQSRQQQEVKWLLVQCTLSCLVQSMAEKTLREPFIRVSFALYLWFQASLCLTHRLRSGIEIMSSVSYWLLHPELMDTRTYKDSW